MQTNDTVHINKNPSTFSIGRVLLCAQGTLFAAASPSDFDVVSSALTKRQVSCNFMSCFFAWPPIWYNLIAQNFSRISIHIILVSILTTGLLCIIAPYMIHHLYRYSVSHLSCPVLRCWLLFFKPRFYI